MIDINVKVSRYKCFDDIPGGFDCIKPINLIIGRNNTGKSSLLDLIEHLCHQTSVLNPSSKIHFQKQLQEQDLRSVFKDNLSSYESNLGKNQYSRFGYSYIGHILRWEIDANLNNIIPISVIGEKSKDFQVYDANPAEKKLLTIPKKLRYVLDDFQFRRLLADRDIVLEPKSKDLNLDANGFGATNIIQRYITHSDHDRNVIQIDLLNALNKIFEPDAHFTEIQVQMYDGITYQNQFGISSFGDNEPSQGEPDKWEIFLGEKAKGLIALSKSGSGLKTIILVLLNLLVIPKENKNKEIDKFIFAFEELENNLHPSLLRRLHKFLFDFAIKNDCHIFLTTHSNVAIDQFAGNEKAQIVHVKHDGKKATAETIDTYIGRTELLDDLGAKASDILQANGLVWLEGPSDRIYFNKWIEILSKGELQEGRDYECIFYGGSNLANYDAKDPLDEETLKEKINIMKINRNAILIGDSDKTSPRMRLKGRLAQLKPPMKELGAYIWITSAKEIENYIPVEALRKHYSNDKLPKVELYQQFSYLPKSKKTAKARQKPKGYLQKYLKRGSERYDKVDLARKTSQYFSEENLESCFELKEEMTNIISIIKGWNEI